MYGCESWTIKKAECQKNDAFELWCWRKLLSPLDCKEIQPVHAKGNQSWIFIGRTDAKAETPILWPPDRRTDSLDKTLMLGKIEGGRRRGWQRMRCLDGITDLTWVWVNSGSWWWTGRPGVLQSMGLQRVGNDWVTELKGLILIGYLNHIGGKGFSIWIWETGGEGNTVQSISFDFLKN